MLTMGWMGRAPRALVLALLVVTGLGASAPALAQQQEISPEHLSLARKYLDLTDKAALYEATIVRAGINTYQTIEPTNPGIAKQLNDAITKVIGTYRGKKGELFDQFARIYAQAFSQDELQQIVDFYSSEVGQKLSDANSKLNENIAQVMELYSYNLRTEFFAAVRAELKAMGIDV